MPSAPIGDIHIGQNDAWKVPGGRWPATVLAIVLIDVVCFYAFSLFAMDTTHFVWMSLNAGALVFGPVIWMEHRRLHRKGATLRGGNQAARASGRNSKSSNARHRRPNVST
jgi:hypothetical protein